MKQEDFNIRFIDKAEILSIIPLLSLLNPKIEQHILVKRSLEMIEQNYSCLGIYNKKELVGICGLWYMTRHYSGKCIEPDHVIIDQRYRGKGLGKFLFDWIFNYAEREGFESTELNTYVGNTKSHKFYFNLGYEIKGYHFVKFLD